MNKERKIPDSSKSRPRTEPLLMDEKQAATLLGFSERTLQSWRCRGGGPPFIRVSARCIRYRREDLEAWVEANRRISTSDPGHAGRISARGDASRPAED